MSKNRSKITALFVLGILAGTWGGAVAPAQADEEAVTPVVSFLDKDFRKKKQQESVENLQKRFEWWPTDAKPGAVKDEKRGGYWWWPSTPGQIKPWGNRGYVYVYKIIFDYKEEDLPPPQPQELRPSLLVRRMIKNVKVYFDFDKAALRDDARQILDDGLRALRKNPKASVLITGNADTRGSEGYNDRLGRNRAATVSEYLAANGVGEDRIRIVSRGKLDAAAPVTDLVGMQKDRNAQFVVAEVEEVMLPYQGPPRDFPSVQVNEQTYLVQEQKEVESGVKVSTREYVVQKGDSLARIAKRELGSEHRWRFLHEFNKERIQNPDRLRPGQKILIPEE